MSPTRRPLGFPEKQGLYDPEFEKDSCGIGFIVHAQGKASRKIITQGLQILENLAHRGAQGCDPCTGDGGGILIQIPHSYFEAVTPKLGITLPAKDYYGIGMIFMPKDNAAQVYCQRIFEQVSQVEGLTVLGWRKVDVNSSECGIEARKTEPDVYQVFLARGRYSQAKFERKLYLLRRQTYIALNDSHIHSSKTPSQDHLHQFYICSLSSRTIIYKGLLLPAQLPRYYPELKDPRMKSALAMVHSRFSTNTFPTWSLAHPYRFICHNGEINTLRGNVNWMKAREGRMRSTVFRKDVDKLFPVIREDQSDSACLDNAIEFLVMNGRSISHAMAMLIPEPWEKNIHLSSRERGFFEYHANLIEPWDGPAAVCFTDGKTIGAVLDRNGLRPCRYLITKDHRVIVASEVGVLPISPSEVVKKGRLHPGKMFLVDTENGRICENKEIKTKLARQKPYHKWVKRHSVELEKIKVPKKQINPQTSIQSQQQTQIAKSFGYTQEELKMVIEPMAKNAEEPTSSMGNDTPLAVLSEHSQLLFKYFRQLFAQVTNPPIDSLREYSVMSLTSFLGRKSKFLEEKPTSCRRLKLKQPILTAKNMARLKAAGKPFATAHLSTLFPVDKGPASLHEALRNLCQQACKAILAGKTILVLSDRGVTKKKAAMPSLLAVSCVHHFLVRHHKRTKVSLVVESGEPRDVHHFACLFGYGAEAIHPYLALEFTGKSIGQKNFIKAVNKGLLKIFSKMGISTLQSYCGAQVFEALGLSEELVNKYFTGTVSRLGGKTLEDIAEETLRRHQEAFQSHSALAFGGEIHYRIQEEHHNWNPETIFKLQQATKKQSYKTFQEFSTLVNDESKAHSTLRGLLDFHFLDRSIPIAEVEPASQIVRRFNTGAMSFGSLSREAHETLAIAMNQIGGKSNSGEGGEDPERFYTLPNGDSKNSYIKQIASARFGVNSHYIANAKELQIKIAQGAKPGEGGQLPGYKVDEVIAKLRFSTSGVQLISPPPHHDIYSIEDLAQLIFDLKNANPSAAISVKLVSEIGVGIIAAGVAKAKAHKVLISGDSGGTGASPLSSIKYAGLPWELGLAETQQTLLLNNLRGRIRVETDGQMKTGRDVVVAALLGAEEFGFSTAPLIVEGCIMMRKCHLNTCPVGVATQDPVLRAKFTGKPDHLVNYFFFVAEEVREYMARLGFRSVDEMIGRVERLRVATEKFHGLDLSPILHKPDIPVSRPLYCVETCDNRLELEAVLDQKLIEISEPALKLSQKVHAIFPISNRDRATGAMLSHRISITHGSKGLPQDTISIRFTGSAGQSFGAFLTHGVSFHLDGEANDYLGKGLSGGRIVVVGSPGTLVGNVALYGATAGDVFISGEAGERFAVRNSGAHVVVEGTGDHGCEYMTGGIVVVLGKTGRNFAAGMSGGLAFIYNKDRKFLLRCNQDLVEVCEPTQEDRKTIESMLEEHVRFTQSDRAKKILTLWNSEKSNFVKVFPFDYKRVLKEKEVELKKEVEPKKELAHG